MSDHPDYPELGIFAGYGECDPRYFDVGNIVRQKHDHRHVGEIISIGEMIRVRWDDTGWFSDLRADEIELTNRE